MSGGSPSRHAAMIWSWFLLHSIIAYSVCVHGVILKRRAPSIFQNTPESSCAWLRGRRRNEASSDAFMGPGSGWGDLTGVESINLFSLAFGSSIVLDAGKDVAAILPPAEGPFGAKVADPNL